MSDYNFHKSRRVVVESDMRERCLKRENAQEGEKRRKLLWETIIYSTCIYLSTNYLTFEVDAQ